MKQDLHKLAIIIAQKSPCTKRKVGAIIVDKQNKVIATGFNTYPEGGQEFDDEGRTHPDVIHAEVVACKAIPKNTKPHKIIVTHEPCDACRISILAAKISEIEIASIFMKWSQGKIMYDLVPVIALKRLAEVFTYGAKKYKPRNYLECEDPQEFVNALFRHLEAYREGELNDPESGLPHLGHLMCCASILLDIEDHKTKNPQKTLKGIIT